MDHIQESDIPCHENISAPSWKPFAHEIIQRLRITVQQEAQSSATCLMPGLYTPDATGTSQADYANQNPEVETNEPLDDIDAPGPSRDVAGRLPTSQILQAIRFAASFGKRQDFEKCLAPGAITVLCGMRRDETKSIQNLLRLGTLPPGWRILVDPHYATTGANGLLVLGPDSDGSEISKFARQRFFNKIAEAIEGSWPIMVLCPDEVQLPTELSRFLPRPTTMAPIDRAIMLHLLRLTYEDEFDAPEIHAALPPDPALAGIPPLGLAAALRAPTALAAATRLGEILRPTGTDDGKRLEDMMGEDEALAAARQILGDLRLWKKGKLRWSEMPRSLLMYGQPGTGKTYLAEALGRSAGITFIFASFANLQAAGHLGLMLAAMYRSFADALQQAPTILFIDEIDASGSREDGDRHGSNYRHQVINGFLQHMDSISRQEGVIVIAACNYPDRIDPAILRAGRFDLKIEVPLPDEERIFEILRDHLGEVFPDEGLRTLARRAVGNSAADVDAAVRKALSLARAEMKDLRLEGVRAELVTSDPESESWAWRAAVHECGHAIFCTALGLAEVKRVMLTLKGGETVRQPFEFHGVLRDVKAEMAYGMAGRAAELLVLGDASGGAGGAPASDLARVTRSAIAIDTRYGLGAYGPIWIDTPDAFLLRDPEALARVRDRIEEAEAWARVVLEDHRDLLEQMARALAEVRLLKGKPLASLLSRVTRHA